MSKQYWLTLIIDPHNKYPLSHSHHVSICCYIDADGVFNRGDGHREGPFTPNNKRITPGFQQGYSPSIRQYDFKITEEQYHSANSLVYLWGEPYGSVAMQGDVAADLLSGRLELSKKACVAGGEAAPPASSQPGDEQLIYKIKTGDSVAQFIANEMNNNGKSGEVEEMRRALAGLAPDAWAPVPVIPQAREAKAEELLAKYTHAVAHPARSPGDNIPAYLQTAYFGGGGQWDHKGQIYAAWGAQNRLGNRGYVYYYDIWSNFHFGYIAAAAGIPLFRVVAGAGYAQTVDTGSDSSERGWWPGLKRAGRMTGALFDPPNWRSDDEMKEYLFKDDNRDRRAIINGYNLYGSRVDFRSLIRIISQFPDQWLVRK